MGWSIWRWGSALQEHKGEQTDLPSVALVNDVANISPDAALQISTVWACIDRRATTIASLPFMVYDVDSKGQRVMARSSTLWSLLHDSPNGRMTPFEFWRTMMMNHDLRGNAYARIDRRPNGEAVSLWPMPADQVSTYLLSNGEMLYEYEVDGNVAVFAQANVLHLKNLGNGNTGFSKLEFMRTTTDELMKAQQSAAKVFGNGGKPTGILMLDKTLTDEQRDRLRARFSGLAEGSTSRLAVLEHTMTYQQLSISPEDQQLLETRQFGVEEICRWFDVPPVLVHHANVTAWGSGIEQIVDGYQKLTVRPLLVGIEQALRKRVMTSKQRVSQTIEVSQDALLRGNIKDRFDVYSKAVQNGLKTRNECRQLENDPPMIGGDELTAQSNLAPIGKLGELAGGKDNVDSQDPIAQ